MRICVLINSECHTLLIGSFVSCIVSHAVLSVRRWCHGPVWHLHQWTVTAKTGCWALCPRHCHAVHYGSSQDDSVGQADSCEKLQRGPSSVHKCVWKCVWVSSLARRWVCESRCYSDCIKASERLIIQKERDEEKSEHNCWITGLCRPSLTNASSCHLILGRFVFVAFQYPEIGRPCAHNAAWGKQGLFEF